MGYRKRIKKKIKKIKTKKQSKKNIGLRLRTKYMIFFDFSRNFKVKNIGKFYPINFKEEKKKFFKNETNYNPCF